MTASCDTCRRPGSCCSGFVLSLPTIEPGPGWRDEAMEQVRRRGLDHFELMGHRVSLSYPGTIVPVWRCRRLGPDGRCSDYENRPLLCRLYEPGSDQLCAEFVTRFKGVPITWGAR